jgi:predicted metal-binding membrane protein
LVLAQARCDRGDDHRTRTATRAACRSAEYLMAYLAIWSLFGLLATWLTITAWPHGAPAVAPVALLLVAAAWHVTPARRRALRRCGKPTRVRVRGWRGDTDCLTAGIAAGRPCLITCAPLMVVTHSAVLMVAITGLMLSERRRGPNPARRLGRPYEALCLVLLAGVTGASAMVLHRDLR